MIPLYSQCRVLHSVLILGAKSHGTWKWERVSLTESHPTFSTLQLNTILKWWLQNYSNSAKTWAINPWAPLSRAISLWLKVQLLELSEYTDTECCSWVTLLQDPQPPMGNTTAQDDCFGSLDPVVPPKPIVITEIDYKIPLPIIVGTNASRRFSIWWVEVGKPRDLEFVINI